MNKKYKEKRGITLVTLIITIVLLAILSALTVNAGTQSLSNARFKAYAYELKILQEKVNELNQNKEFNLGEELTPEQKALLNKKEINDVLSKEKNETEVQEIKSGFRYFSADYIKNTLKLQGINEDFLINVKKRILVSVKGHVYKGVTYYMSDQMSDGYYNVEYNNNSF